jgi:hypothetical protein
LNSSGSLPAGWQDQDIGGVGVPGNASYDNGTYTVQGSGSNIWYNSDQFHFVYTAWSGDGQIVARVASEQNTNPYAKVGVMLRQSLDPSSAYADMFLTPNGDGDYFQYRTVSGGGCGGLSSGNNSAPYWVKLVRQGNNIRGFTSPDNLNWTLVGGIEITLTDPVYFGLEVVSINNGLLNTSTFDNVVVSSTLTESLPSSWQDQDIGSVGVPGSASYDNGTYTVQGSGSDIWGSSDQFHFVYTAWSGDGQIVARVASQQNTNPYAKVGVMLRQSLDANSAFADMFLTPNGDGDYFQYRTVNGGGSSGVSSGNGSAPYWVKLVRQANNIRGFASPDGLNWTLVGGIEITLTDPVYFGLEVVSINNGLLNTSTFDNVQVSSTLSESLPSGWLDTDIGSVGLSGSASYDNGTYTVQGSGSNIWYNSDQFHYVYTAWSGDGQIVARVASEQNTHPYAKVGVMLRQSLDANSAFADMFLTPNGDGDYFQYRTVSGGGSGGVSSGNNSAPYWVKLVRQGNTIQGFTSSDNLNWSEVGEIVMTLSDPVYFGLEVVSINNGLLNTSTFDNVRVGGVASSLAVVGGDGQSANLNTAFDAALQAKVTDSKGNPLSGVSVTFTAPTGNIVAAAATTGSNKSGKPVVSKTSPKPAISGGTVVKAQDSGGGEVASGTFGDSGTNVTTAITDANGIATAASFSANSITGNYAVTASVNGLASTASFNLTNFAGITAPASPSYSYYVTQYWSNPSTKMQGSLAYEKGYNAIIGDKPMIILAFGRQFYNVSHTPATWEVVLTPIGGNPGVHEGMSWVAQVAQDFMQGYNDNPKHTTAKIAIGTSTSNYPWLCDNSSNTVSGLWTAAGEHWGQMIASLQALVSDNLTNVDVLSGDDIETWHREFPDPTNPSVDEWDGCGLGVEAWYDGFESQTSAANVDFGSNGYGELSSQWTQQQVYDVASGKNSAIAYPLIFCNGNSQQWAQTASLFPAIRFAGITSGNGDGGPPGCNNTNLTYKAVVAWNNLNNALHSIQLSNPDILDSSVTYISHNH